ncbi:hypothetical protein [Roseovarius sp. D0-M9]|uniref:hypothetical protein n=1 Tax=Roseovarius sp. D0-M9 TaxID=3127117 RepID=UPI00300F9F02
MFQLDPALYGGMPQFSLDLALFELLSQEIERLFEQLAQSVKVVVPDCINSGRCKRQGMCAPQDMGGVAAYATKAVRQSPDHSLWQRQCKIWRVRALS